MGYEVSDVHVYVGKKLYTFSCIDSAYEFITDIDFDEDCDIEYEDIQIAVLYTSVGDINSASTEPLDEDTFWCSYNEYKTLVESYWD